MDLVGMRARLQQLSQQRRPALAVPHGAAVLVPFCRVQGELALLYTLRAASLRSHRGEVSFPGGKCDPYESPEQTATREYEEELGQPFVGDVLGRWRSIPNAEQTLAVVPVVTYIGDVNIAELNVSRNMAEVAEVFAVPVSELQDPERMTMEERRGYSMPRFHLQPHVIWGLTGFITHGVLSCFLPAA